MNCIFLIRFANVMVKKIIFYILLIYFNYSFSQKDFLFKYDTAVLNKDIKILKKVLLFNHPAVDFYGGYHFFSNYFDTAFQVKYPMNEKEFRMFLKSKLNVLKCGHTNILPSNRYLRSLKKKSFKVMPYFICLDNMKLIVVKGFEKQDTLLQLFDTIIQIDKINAEQIIESMKKLIYTDGNAEKAKEEIIQKHFTFYFSSLAEKDSFLLTIKTKQGVKDIYIKTREYWRVKNELLEMKTDTFLKNFRRKYYAGMFLNKQKSVYYMKIKSFSGIKMKAQFRRAFRNMNKNNTDYLIIDLRNNPGGKISQSVDLLTYLLPHTDSLFYQKVIYKMEEKKYIHKKLEYRIIDFFLRWRCKQVGKQNLYIEKIPVQRKNHFKGKVYVLVNANTFSAANLVAIYLSKRPNTIIAGSEPSGVKWGSHAVSFLRLYLPHTKIKVLIPTYRIIHNLNNSDIHLLLNPIKPPIYTPYTAKDLLLKKDKEMEVIIKDIMKK